MPSSTSTAWLRAGLSALVATGLLAGCGSSPSVPAADDHGSGPPPKVSPSDPPAPVASPPAWAADLITVEDLLRAFPDRDPSSASYEADRRPARVVGSRCGTVPGVPGGNGEELTASGAGAVLARTARPSSDALFADETAVQLPDATAAGAVLDRYRSYLARCGTRTYGGDFDGTVSSAVWPLPGVGDDAVGMLDSFGTRNGEVGQRTAVVRLGRTVIILDVYADDGGPVGAAATRQLLTTAVARAD